MKGNRIKNNHSNLQLQAYRQSLSFLTSQMIRTTLSPKIQIHIKQQKEPTNKIASQLKTSLSQILTKISQIKTKLQDQNEIILEDGSEQDDNSTRIDSLITNNQHVSEYRQNLLHHYHSNPNIRISPIKKHTKHYQYYINQIIKGQNKCDGRVWQHFVSCYQFYKKSHHMVGKMEGKKLKLLKSQKFKDKKTLLIDIDETLLHCSEEQHFPHDISLQVQVQGGQYVMAYIKLRPFVISFLKRISQHYQIIAFTASHQSYADVVLDYIDPNHQIFQHRLYRKHCFQIKPNIYAKDLRIIDRQLSQIVLVDNAPHSYIFQPQNGIPIVSYYQGSDKQLLKLQKYLLQLKQSKDIRQTNKFYFKFHHYYKYKTVQELISQLYIQ